MNELEIIKSQLNDINNKRVKLQTLVEQAQKQCSEIEEKYGVKSPDELLALMTKAEEAYKRSLNEARQYIQDTNKVLDGYVGII